MYVCTSLFSIFHTFLYYHLYPELPKASEDACKWAQKLAEIANRAYTHGEANRIAASKGIKPVEITGKYQVKEILTSYENGGKLYLPLTTMFLFDGTDKNIATFIYIDEKTLVICDEFGRTFWLRVKSVINDVVNALIDAGYKHTVHPERYVREATQE